MMETQQKQGYVKPKSPATLRTMKAKLTLHKIEAAEPYSNPGSRFSLLGSSKAARWGLFDEAGNQLCEIRASGGRHKIWIVVLPDRTQWAAGTRKDAEASARRHFGEAL